MKYGLFQTLDEAIKTWNSISEKIDKAFKEENILQIEEKDHM